ncbi:MBL fold metallo-hydrolase [Nocardioides sp. SLBN-35]|uniref:MBL fold metallo-hydrolase n=1 Tax=Nocardioides sp. SLBN-35 TaxID=2768445 RepID=UPI00116A214F|nr:MBL fold metallo-hydrolase [Nocardioides sp. SLBN-35]TQK68515.1 glyoxylase-like metal-dependent hydrolase (beta-lactamase superfamily II) [Nocardioides sp. SLBN-35]
MRISHLNCATMRPALAPTMVAHVLLLERPEGLALVDTGFGTGDLADRSRLGRPFLMTVRPDLDPGETALAQVKARGHDPAEVTDIVLTHLDLDHAGGIGDFPNARIHVHATEHAAATHPSLREKARYVAGQWAHTTQWTLHEEGGDDWFGFASVTALADDVVIIPLHGHTRGHAGVAVRRDDGRWLLHAGDAFFHGGQLHDPPTCPVSLTAFQRLMAVDNRQRVANLERLRELARGNDQVTVICAHDKAQYDELSAT